MTFPANFSARTAYKNNIHFKYTLLKIFEIVFQNTINLRFLNLNLDTDIYFLNTGRMIKNKQCFTYTDSENGIRTDRF